MTCLHISYRNITIVHNITKSYTFYYSLFTIHSLEVQYLSFSTQICLCIPSHKPKHSSSVHASTNIPMSTKSKKKNLNRVPIWSSGIASMQHWNDCIIRLMFLKFQARMNFWQNSKNNEIWKLLKLPKKKSCNWNENRPLKTTFVEGFIMWQIIMKNIVLLNISVS